MAAATRAARGRHGDPLHLARPGRTSCLQRPDSGGLRRGDLRDRRRGRNDHRRTGALDRRRFSEGGAVINLTKNRTLLQVAFAVLPILASLVITSLLIIAVNADPRAVFQNVWDGAFHSSNAFAGVVNFWIPLALCSIGLIVTFTAGLWNIGVEGQMGMGAVFASWAALYVTLPQPAQIALEVALAMLGGAL